ncbi:helix-turn-helix domain-containing protein [Streptomyces sp. GS7]|uniref:helix-turn-helix domain-containing protein n=1 Tax=Streptomyces sp. GS7 TaxID=2692234 RepID=UPI001316D318|nr:helix-turn-helix transcriptional regulator [Streptomyces sp. GS7]QHC25672.1 helix-turn-helix domain-containing protein [Streptomyces sp. GS7]
MAALFGTRLRKLRLAAGLTQTALGDAVRTHSTRINQVERCTGAKPTLELARALDAAVGADGLLVDLWPYVYREMFPNWAEVFIARSARAVLIRQYAASVVPGLLQTEGYARAVLSIGRTLKSPEQLEERLASRLARQRLLRRPDGPVLWVVLDESILLRPVGGSDVMRAQLARLLETADDPRVTVQILPFSSGVHGAVEGSMTLLTLPDEPECAYTESSECGQLVDEPEEVATFAETYDHARALALPPTMSLDMIRSVMEGTHRAERIWSRSERRRLAQVQLQQQGGWRLRRGGGRLPRRRGLA